MPANPTRTGWTFGGWWTEKNGLGTEFTASTAVSEDLAIEGVITIYAVWSVAYSYAAPSSLGSAENGVSVAGQEASGGKAALPVPRWSMPQAGKAAQSLITSLTALAAPPIRAMAARAAFGALAAARAAPAWSSSGGRSNTNEQLGMKARSLRTVRLFLYYSTLRNFAVKFFAALREIILE
jgi:uncharacterized repeat protein (TIGR02543 family)